ncbi:hypothetical protein COT07_02995 [Candidatus Woesearchaeota archaeon CG07_land_8_20_14_0_80_44_23]|nr:MAG: hypothetical protein COT07_02995 [Candidatus Woesearchaeota archaeon CG07_land_8_20_14_0_80_44_23]
MKSIEDLIKQHDELKDADAELRKNLKEFEACCPSGYAGIISIFVSSQDEIFPGQHSINVKFSYNGCKWLSEIPVTSDAVRKMLEKAYGLKLRTSSAKIVEHDEMLKYVADASAEKYPKADIHLKFINPKNCEKIEINYLHFNGDTWMKQSQTSIDTFAPTLEAFVLLKALHKDKTDVQINQEYMEM